MVSGKVSSVSSYCIWKAKVKFAFVLSSSFTFGIPNVANYKTGKGYDKVSDKA